MICLMFLFVHIRSNCQKDNRPNIPTFQLFSFLPRVLSHLNDQESRLIGSLASNPPPFKAPLFYHVKWHLTAHQWSSMTLGTIISLNKLLPWSDSLTWCFLCFTLLLSVFIQVFSCSRNKSSSSFSLTSSTSYFFSLCENGKEMLTQRIAKQWTISVNYLNFLVLKTTIYHGSVTKTPRMQPVNRHSI